LSYQTSGSTPGGIDATACWTLITIIAPPKEQHPKTVDHPPGGVYDLRKGDPVVKLKTICLSITLVALLALGAYWKHQTSFVPPQLVEMVEFLNRDGLVTEMNVGFSSVKVSTPDYTLIIPKNLQSFRISYTKDQMTSRNTARYASPFFAHPITTNGRGFVAFADSIRSKVPAEIDGVLCTPEITGDLVTVDVTKL
jgi:hypothetical protein